MAKLTVNIGETANDRNADSLRTAFAKINENFTELYSALGLNSDITLNLGAFEFNGSTMTTTDSSSIVINQATTVTSDLTVLGDIIPSENLRSTLGSPTKQFHSIYVGTGSVYLGDARLSLESGKLTSSVGFNLTGSVGEVSGAVEWDNVLNKPTIPSIAGLASEDYVDTAISNIPAVDLSGYALTADIPDVSSFITAEDIPAIPADISDLTDTNGLLGQGGSSTTELAYLELTQTPFIIQPVVSGTPVTVISPAAGQGAQVEIVIGAGPVITSITVTTAGTGYAVGQRYRVWFYQIGGNNDDSSIEFEVATVGEAGELLTVTNAAFTGSSLSNIPNTYSEVSIELRSSMVFDEISPGLTLTRDRGRALYNSELELEYDRNNHTSPLGTEWNSDGWDNLVGFGVRSYTTFREALNNQVGNNIIGAELIMRDIANNRYYKFSFSVWGENNGAYTYTRTEITDPNFFEKLDYATANNVDVIEDDSTLQIGITRGNNNGIYNPFTEEGWNSDVSPQGTLWNIDGWDDLTDVETRTYTNFYDAYDGNLGNRVPGSKAVMYVPSIDKYYAIQWFNWTQGINGNSQGGGFSYLRYELDLTKLQEGIAFADGTVQKTAYVPTNVKLRSPGERRIEEVYGYKEVAVTSRTVDQEFTGVTLSPTLGPAWDVFIDGTVYIEFYAYVSNFQNQQMTLLINDVEYTVQPYISGSNIILYAYIENAGGVPVSYSEGDAFTVRKFVGGEPVTWWNKSELPSGGSDFRGAVIDYHAYIPGRGTIVGTIHIVDDDGEENITHTEVSSGSSDLEYSDLWLVTDEGRIQYRQLDGDDRTLKVQWTAKVFYGSEYYND